MLLIRTNCSLLASVRVVIALGAVVVVGVRVWRGTVMPLNIGAVFASVRLDVDISRKCRGRYECSSQDDEVFHVIPLESARWRAGSPC